MNEEAIWHHIRHRLKEPYNELVLPSILQAVQHILDGDEDHPVQFMSGMYYATNGIAPAWQVEERFNLYRFTGRKP